MEHLCYVEDVVASAQEDRTSSNPQDWDKQGHFDLLWQFGVVDN